MEKNVRLITGSIFLIIGLILLGLSVFIIFPIFYAIPLIIIGILLLINAGDEDKIEGVKNTNIKKKGN